MPSCPSLIANPSSRDNEEPHLHPRPHHHRPPGPGDAGRVPARCRHPEPPNRLNTYPNTTHSQVYLSTKPWGSGESAFFDFAVVDPEACHDLDEPVRGKAETFWLIGGDCECYLFK